MRVTPLSLQPDPGATCRPRGRLPRAGGGSRVWLARALLALTIVAAAPAPAAGPVGETPLPDGLSQPRSRGALTLRPVPQPDLSRVEPSVRETLGEVRQNLLAALESSAITERELAEAYAATGAHYLAYRIWEAAEPCYANAAALAPDDYRWPYYLGYRYVQDSRLDLAAASYERALAIRPDYLPARLRLGLVYLELGQGERATPLLEEAAADPGLRAMALFGLGRAALARKDAAAAVEHLEAALAASPDASRIHYPLAMAYRALGRVEEARSHLGQRGEGDPRLPDPLIDELADLLKGTRTLYFRGIEAVRNGHYEVAVEAFAEALARDPDNANARVTLARARFLTGDRDGARRELDEALARRPDHDLGLFLRGVLAEEDGDAPGAAALYRRVLAVDPDHAGAHHYLASALMREGRWEEAARHYAAAVAAMPQNGPARLYEALALVRAGDHRAARARLEAGASELPQEAVLRLALARLLAASPQDGVRDGARALALAQPLYDGLPSLDHAETLAMALAEAGRPAEAADLQARAIDAVTRAGRLELLARLQEDLARYRAGEPSRRPWSAFDPAFVPPPIPARGPFQDYPTLEAY
jgi:tetratricopeptide (TPR) repeat protein